MDRSQVWARLKTRVGSPGGIAVGMPVARHPPHRSVREDTTSYGSYLGSNDKPSARRGSNRSRATLARLLLVVGILCTVVNPVLCPDAVLRLDLPSVAPLPSTNSSNLSSSFARFIGTMGTV